MLDDLSAFPHVLHRPIASERPTDHFLSPFVQHDRIMTFECPSWPPDWPEIDAAVRAGGPHRATGAGTIPQTCRDLQERIAEISGVLDARLCCSGTAALEIALRAAQVGPGDEVALAAYDFPGNFRTVELLGARPFCWMSLADSLAIDPEQLDSLVASGQRQDASAL